ncbi:MAG TPA: carbohydrate porin [Steroidobacteraceae bacterium]|nr:carbohydrate porin [Steroidobacteraceae bacterium]
MGPGRGGRNGGGTRPRDRSTRRPAGWRPFRWACTVAFVGVVLAGATLVPGTSLADDRAQADTLADSQESVPEGQGASAPASPAPAQQETQVPVQPAGPAEPPQDPSQPPATPSVSHWPQIVGAQYTFIRQHQTELTSPYEGPRSLDPTGDTQSSHTIGLYLGWALLDNLQLYLDTEKFMGAGVSGAQGLAGLPNGDVIRQGAGNLPKRFYVARKFIRYLIALPGSTTKVAERAQDQLSVPEPATRIEIKAGVLAANDDFDLNRYANSTRTQFMNWSLWNNGAWDFAADTRGYTEGVVVGFVSPQWSVKYGLYEMPVRANQQQLESSIRKARGENLELTYKPGADDNSTVIRALVYRNTARMGIYEDAIAFAAATGTVPDIVAQDREGRHKTGFGVNVEQPLADDGETGVFARAGWNDGKTESFAFTEIDRTLSAGGQLAGGRWKRPEDRVAVAIAVNGLSGAHRQYLADGGVGFLLGDGRLNYGPEEILETFYRAQFGHYVQLSPDVQYIRDPGYNRDRGPVTVWGLRLHVQY